MMAATAPAPVLQAERLSKVFAGPPDVHALRDATFTIGRGEFVALTGPSGSGKSTLLALLGLLDEASGGRLLLEGEDVTGLDERARAALRAHRIGFVFQAFHLLGYRTVRDNVELGLLYQGRARRERRQRSEALIEQVGLGHRRDTMCAVLSGGERQRVALARALVRQPSLILCDEPTGNLDSATSAAVLDLIVAMHAHGLTVLVITHDPEVARRAGRRLVIADGIVAAGGDL